LKSATSANGVAHARQSRPLALPSADGEPVPVVNGVLVSERLLVAGLRAQERADEADEARRRLGFLFKASQQLAASLEPTTTMQALARLVVPDFGESCIVHTLETVHRHRELTVACCAAVGSHPPDWWEWLARVTRPAARRVARTARSETRSTRGKLRPQHLPDVPDMTYLVVPLCARSRTLGTLTVTSPAATRRYAPEDLIMGEALGAQAGLALENAQLYEQQRLIVERLKLVHDELDEAHRKRLRDDERRRIARDLHDNVAQTFFAIGLTAHAGLDSREAGRRANEPLAEALSSAADLAAAGAEQLRAAIFALNNAEFAAHGLVPALWALVRGFQERTHVEADLILTGQERPLPTEVAEGMYALAREALTNVERHAQAASVVLGLHINQRSITLTVHDDGSGASPLVLKQVEDSMMHFGLRGLRERVQRLHGTFAAGPNPDGGFLVRAHIPFSKGRG
jgi:signal transduction histidine kinase